MRNFLRARLAEAADAPALKELMAAAMAENMKPFLSPELIAASYAVMGLDTALIADGTYWIVYSGDEIAGCGGWSRRATLYGGDHSAGRSAALLDPAVDAARVRAMYTHPRWVRRGVGSLILTLCEAAAAREGFSRLELMATLPGEPLYRARGFVELDRIEDGGVPLIRMTKPIAAAPSLMSIPAGNLFADIPVRLGAEQLTQLLATPDVRVERIVSTGQTTPAGRFYDQDWMEWVLVLQGSARLLFEGEPEPRLLGAGDHVLIPPHRRHRVDWTDPDRPTVWLAIHVKAASVGK